MSSCKDLLKHKSSTPISEIYRLNNNNNNYTENNNDNNDKNNNNHPLTPDSSIQFNKNVDSKVKFRKSLSKSIRDASEHQEYSTPKLKNENDKSEDEIKANNKVASILSSCDNLDNEKNYFDNLVDSFTSQIVIFLIMISKFFLSNESTQLNSNLVKKSFFNFVIISFICLFLIFLVFTYLYSQNFNEFIPLLNNVFNIKNLASLGDLRPC